MEKAQILITGVTGAVGGEVARMLFAEGVPYRALVRDRAKASDLSRAGVEVVNGSYDDPEGLVTAFAGMERLFLVSPLVPQLEEFEGNAIDAAARAGVRHVIKLSTAGVTQDVAGRTTVPRQYPLHRSSEERLERSGLGFTHLRPGPFMQNTLNLAPSIVAEGIFRGAWGDGRMGYVDVRDVARVAVTVLRGGDHDGQSYELTGPEALSPADVARKLSAATGREVRYVDVPVDGVRRAMLTRGMPDWFVGAMVEVMEHTRDNAAARVTQTVTELTGHPPRSYDDFAREFSFRFVPAQ